MRLPPFEREQGEIWTCGSEKSFYLFPYYMANFSWMELHVYGQFEFALPIPSVLGEKNNCSPYQTSILRFPVIMMFLCWVSCSWPLKVIPFSSSAETIRRHSCVGAKAIRRVNCWTILLAVLNLCTFGNLEWTPWIDFSIFAISIICLLLCQ